MSRNTYFTLTGVGAKIMGADASSVQTSKVCEGSHWLTVRQQKRGEEMLELGGETNDTIFLESGKVN